MALGARTTRLLGGAGAVVYQIRATWGAERGRREWDRGALSLQGDRGNHTTFERVGHRAPHISLRFIACLRGQSAVMSCDHSYNFGVKCAHLPVVIRLGVKSGHRPASPFTTVPPFTAPAFLSLLMHCLLLFSRQPVAAHHTQTVRIHTVATTRRFLPQRLR